jgi:hypothetical protein
MHRSPANELQHTLESVNYATRVLFRACNQEMPEGTLLFTYLPGEALSFGFTCSTPPGKLQARDTSWR